MITDRTKSVNARKAILLYFQRDWFKRQVRVKGDVV